MKTICTNGLEGEYEDDVSELQLGDIISGLNAAGRNGRFFAARNHDAEISVVFCRKICYFNLNRQNFTVRKRESERFSI